MEFKLTISKNRKYLIIDVFNTITEELQRRFVEEGVETMKKNNIKNVLVDVNRVPNTANVYEKYKLAYYETDRLGYPRDGKIAVFVNPGDNSHDFIETAFRNAGYQCSIFKDKNSAVEWLNK